MPKSKDFPVKIYFENLNAIRFIAAFFVIVYHIEQAKSGFNIVNHGVGKIARQMGNLGVNLFFVLSGFLISYLLFKEQEITTTISIRQFYVRRLLRIWPLYFLIVLSAFFIFPFFDFFTMEGYDKAVVWQNLLSKLLLYILFLPNLVLHVFGFIPYAAHTWTIGAEEQFYFAWPLLNKYCKCKLALLLGVILFYLLIRHTIPFFPLNKYLKVFSGFWRSMPIDNMAIGGLFALLIYENSPAAILIRKIIFTKFFQVATFLIVIVSIIKGFSIPYFYYEYYSLLFGILICNFAFNSQRIFSMENSISRYLGKISYGLYMFNPIGIVICTKLLLYFNMANNYTLYGSSFLVVILMAAVSYQFYEKKFIDKKIRYSKIISGDNVK